MEEHGLKIFQNRVLKKIFRPKEDEAIKGWRKLHNEDLHNLNSSTNIIRILYSRRTRWAGHVERMGRKSIAYRILVGIQKERDN
jgi:hypothetical protein